MTTDTIRQRPLTEEPTNNAFVVWYDHCREPYAVYFRSDTNAWGDQRWFNADQHHGGITDPSDWADLCEDLLGNDGPHLLVPGVEVVEQPLMELNPTGTVEWLKNRVNELTAERDAFRDSALLYAAQSSDLKGRLDSARATCNAYKDEPPALFQGPGLSERGEGYNAGTRDMARAVLAAMATADVLEDAEAPR
ncbi:hypothetical protein AB0C44_08015 [Micromonospora taraxaci]|uniref:hypothetical protein n=1 Tax=Micromonospora taraxaci TaxID=1316803 RepID=UPI0033DD9C8A